MMKCGGRISGEQEIRVQVIRTVGYQAVKEKIEDRGRKTEDGRQRTSDEIGPSAVLRAGSFDYPFDFPFGCAQGFG